MILAEQNPRLVALLQLTEPIMAVDNANLISIFNASHSIYIFIYLYK